MRNAQAMAAALVSRGYDLVSGGTDNHLILIDLRNKGVTGKQADAALSKAHMTVNKNMVPFDDKSPFVTSGIRVGTPAITTRGMVESDMEQIVDWMDAVIGSHENDAAIARVSERVRARMRDLPLYASELV
jgi:glycine hydroxymethyltransferase